MVWDRPGGWRAVLGDGTEARERLARCYREWEFFRATVDSAQREMSRARLPIAREYESAGPRRRAERPASTK